MVKKVIFSFIAFMLFGFFSNAQNFHNIQNRWKGSYINIGNFLNCSVMQTGWHNAQWDFEKVEGTNFYRISNRWKDTQYLHIQDGSIECGSIEASWWSAQWSLEKVEGTNFYRIRNRWKDTQYLHIQNGILKCGSIEVAWWSAQWALVKLEMESELNNAVGNLSIGQSYQGGKIAYILQPGDIGYNANVQHGIIAAPNDQSNGAVWGCYGKFMNQNKYFFPDDHVGDGAQLTMNIMNGCSEVGIAARLCGDLVLGGYSDWYLPNLDELEKLYINRFAIGGFNMTESYSCSSEDGESGCWVRSFKEGFPAHTHKEDPNYVRAVRAF